MIMFVVCSKQIYNETRNTFSVSEASSAWISRQIDCKFTICIGYLVFWWCFFLSNVNGIAMTSQSFQTNKLTLYFTDNRNHMHIILIAFKSISKLDILTILPEKYEDFSISCVFSSNWCSFFKLGLTSFRIFHAFFSILPKRYLLKAVIVLRLIYQLEINPSNRFIK